MIMRNASRLLFGLFALMATFSLGIVLSPKILRASFVRRMAIIGKMAGLTSSPFPALAMTGASSSPKQSLTTACSDVRARNGRVSEPECKHAANLLDSCTKGRNMSFLHRSLPVLGGAALMGVGVGLKLWPGVAFAAVLVLYVVIRQALFEHYLLTRKTD